MTALALFLPLSVIFCFIATLYVRKALLRQSQLDVPNERSMHKTPVPRGGGLAVSGVILTGLLVAAFLYQSYATLLPLIAAAFILIGISWMDDKKGLSPLCRLCVHLLAAMLGTLALPDQTMIFQGTLPLWLDRVLMIVGWAWFMNLYNFMDGIDGITATESISIMMGIAFVMAATGITNLTVYALVVLVSGACLGFLLLNWHPAKIFLGDVGSVPLGFLIGYALLSLVAEGLTVPALILPLYYLADSTYTLIRRALNGEKIWQAHRQHFYQKAALAAGRHDRVVIWIMLGNSGLVLAALVATAYPLAGALAAFGVTFYLLVYMNSQSKLVP